MEKVISKDGTQIAVDRFGSGPALILVDGAMCSRGFGPLPALAIVRHAGGTAMVFGISSGAALAAETARVVPGIRRLALYEAPYVIDNTHEPLPPTFIADTKFLVANNRRSAAVKKFMRYVGTPSLMVLIMPLLPFWKKLTAIAHTLPNDLEIIAPHHNGSEDRSTDQSIDGSSDRSEDHELTRSSKISLLVIPIDLERARADLHAVDHHVDAVVPRREAPRILHVEFG